MCERKKSGDTRLSLARKTRFYITLDHSYTRKTSRDCRAENAHTVFGAGAVYSMVVTPGREVVMTAPLMSAPLSAVSIIFQLLQLTLPARGTPPAGSVTSALISSRLIHLASRSSRVSTLISSLSARILTTT